MKWYNESKRRIRSWCKKHNKEMPVTIADCEELLLHVIRSHRKTCRGIEITTSSVEVNIQGAPLNGRVVSSSYLFCGTCLKIDMWEAIQELDEMWDKEGKS